MPENEYKQTISISDVYSNEEIKLLKKQFPEINNLLQDSFTNKKQKITKNKFFTIILTYLQNFFIKQENNIVTKAISLLMNEIFEISNIIKKNQIYSKCFKSIKNQKIFNNFTKIRNAISECNSKNKTISTNYRTNSTKHSKKFTSTVNCNKSIKVNNSFMDSNLEKSLDNNNDFLNHIKTQNINNLFTLTNDNHISKKENKFQQHQSKKNIQKNNSTILKQMKNYQTKNSIPKKITYNNIKNYHSVKFSPKNNNKTDKSITKMTISSINSSFYLNIDPILLTNIESEKFNIFELDLKIGKDNTLPLIGYYIFNTFGFYDIINYKKFENWCKKISQGYMRENPYHTDLHAADVTHTCFIYFKVGKINEICNLTKISQCGLFLSCICHDYKHPGINNNYLKDTNHKLSIRYNDNSILENMHISKTFKLMKDYHELDLFENVDIKIYKTFRKEMISCVLATDMFFHNDYVNFMKNHENDKDKYQKYMNLLIHSADISNPTKPFEIYFKWALLVVNEFYDQGDKEKKLGLTCSCDREKVTLFKNQLGFINFIEEPYFKLFAECFNNLEFCYTNLIKNREKLIEMQENEDKNKKNKCEKS